MKWLRFLLAVSVVPLFPVVGSSQTTTQIPRELTAQEVFKRVSPSVFIVEALDSGGKVVAFGSGVAAAADQIVTNHHVAEKGFTVRVRRGQTKWPAKVTHDSAGHDLSRLQVEGLKATALQVRKSSTLEVGERVYAIGAPEGLELTFSEGVISALRDFSDGRVIQTTAPISHGSSGGGLFDTQGRLVGITSAGIIEGQNLNFAVPGEWVLALEQSPALTSPAGQSSEAARQALQWTLLCFDYFQRKQYPEAAKACREAIRLKPDFAEAWFSLGSVYGKLGQFQQALEAFKEAIRLKPDDVGAWTNLGRTYLGLGQLQQAVEALKEAIRLKPDDAAAWYGLGLIYLNLGQLQQAVEALKEAIRLKPDDAAAWQSLGSAYSGLGNRAKVMEVYQQLKALDPDRAQKFFNVFVLPQ
jgi:Flp pilus assembly protein TadD